MNPERWRKVEERFHGALEGATDARQTVLDRRCGADTDVRHEVELLLAKEKQAGSFLEVPALEDVTVTAISLESPLGRQFGSYRILSPIGAGGMGEGYRAHDRKLGRDGAI